MGGCPFAQDVLVGNIPTEKLLEALKQRDVAAPIGKPITEPFRQAVDIASRFSGPKM
jgi:hydroxymethylglutaryl-CoA lyase